MGSTNPQAPGVKWRKRRRGPDVPYWFADPKAVKAGYPVRSVNLALYADQPLQLAERAQRLQAEMRLWLESGSTAAPPRFDGTFASLLELYQRDPESPFHHLKRGTVTSYTVYLKQLKVHIGALQIDRCDGRDARRWFAIWRTHPDKPGADQLGAARMALAVLKAALSFGIVCRYPGCRDFKDVLAEMKFEALPPRRFAPTAEQITAARRAAHAHGAPLRALVYALQFETSLRQWDIIGQWASLADPRPSSVIAGGRKWIGPTWRQIGPDLIMARVRPTKTESTTGAEVSFDLSACPMVREELAAIAPERRHGPLIINEATGLPYSRGAFEYNWKRDFKAAGLPAGLWNRDLRAGGITEGGRSGASLDDRRKLAGHTQIRTTEIYDRDTVEAHRRVMAARAKLRDGGEV